LNFATEKLYLEFESIEISIARIKKIVEGLGYKATEESLEEELYDHHKKAKEEEIDSLEKTLYFCFDF
jgi:P-type Cu+ transporter